VDVGNAFTILPHNAIKAMLMENGISDVNRDLIMNII